MRPAEVAAYLHCAIATVRMHIHQANAQAFCYDAQNRLTWASSQSGSVPCGGTLAAGTLTSAAYTSSYAYDTLDRLTSSPLGSYTYGASGHLHAVTAIGSAYTASYDAAGNMTCRAPTSSSTCAGTQTGAQLTYDNEGRLAAWQNAPSNPTSTTSNLYDGAGQRVEQQVVSGGTSTSTVYVGNIEEVSTSAGATITTTSYYAGGKRLAQAVNGTFSYLGSDGLGSAEVALDGSGNAQASILYDPYGNVRYSSGAMPGSYGFTGQHADGATGLDYYNARFYDPAAGQFASGDSVSDGLSRYGYVAGNPESYTDPSGHKIVCGADCNGGGNGGTGCISNCPVVCHIGCGNQGGGSSGGGGTTTRPTTLTPLTTPMDPPPPGCNTIFACTGIHPEGIGTGPHDYCTDGPICPVGYNPSGLFQYLPGIGYDAAALVLEGAAGIQQLLNVLPTLLSEVDTAFGEDIAGYIALLGLGAAVAGVATVFPPAAAPGLLAMAQAGTQLARLGGLESSFTYSYNDFVAELEDLERIAPTALISIGTAGPDYDWTAETLRINFVWTPTSP